MADVRSWFQRFKRGSLASPARAQRKLLENFPSRRRLHPYQAGGVDDNFAVAVVTRSRYFDDYAAQLVNALQQQGVEAVLSDLPDAGAAHAVIVVGLHRYRHAELQELRARSIVCGIQTEQIPSRLQGAVEYGSLRIPNVASALRSCDLVIEWHPSALDPLRQLHPHVVHVPYGSVSSRHAPARLPSEYDVLFIGEVEPHTRRGRILQALQSEFRVFPAHDELWGEDKRRAIDTSRVILNLHVDPALTYESPRLFEALGRRAFVISEDILDSYPFRPKIDYVPTTEFALASVIRTALQDDDWRRRVAQSGYERALAYPIDDSARKILAHILSSYEMTRL